MQQPKVTDHQALLLLDLSMEAEERCDEKIRLHDRRGEGWRCEYLRSLRIQYRSLTERLLEELGCSGLSAVAVDALINSRAQARVHDELEEAPQERAVATTEG